MPQSSDTVSSWRSSSSSRRLRVVSARADRWSRIAGGRATAINPSIRMKGYISRPGSSRRPVNLHGLLSQTPIGRHFLVAISEPITLVDRLPPGHAVRGVRGDAPEAQRVVATDLDSVLGARSLRGRRSPATSGGTYHGFQHVLECAARRRDVEGDHDQHGCREFSAACGGVQRRVQRAGPAVADRRRSARSSSIYVVWMLGTTSSVCHLRLRLDARDPFAARDRRADAWRQRPPHVHRVGDSRVDCRRRGAAERCSSSSAFQPQRPDARRADGRGMAALRRVALACRDAGGKHDGQP